MGKQVESGDSITIHYTGKLADDSVFDSTDGRGPFGFEAGSDMVIEGMSAGVLGMTVGEKRTLTIAPEQAYGDPNPELLIQVETARLPEGVAVGDVLSDDQQRQFKVHAMEGEQATLDANHPLAGQTLIFDVELVSID